MKNDTKRKLAELIWITELFQRYYENRSTENEKQAVENWNAEALHSNSEVKYIFKNKEKEVLWKKISSELKLISYNKYKRKVIIYKYAAIAIIGLFTGFGFYFFVGTIFREKDNSIPNTITKGSINIGTDKAILTLGDGAEVPLNKGSFFRTLNAQSNGSEIIYMPTSANKSSEVATSIEIPYNYLTIPRGGQFLVFLEDGTKVWLNSESKLKYPTSFISGKTRSVELLYGEAYFEVSPSIKHQGSTFKVLTTGQEVEVLGTQFNIKAYQDETTVSTTLVEGKVAINTANNNKVLMPDQQLILDLNTNKVSVYTVDTYNVTSWKKGVFSFTDATLKDIMKVLSRWYNVDIQFKNTAIEEVQFNGVLNKTAPLEEILETLRLSKFINFYEIANNNTTIILK